MIGALRRVSLRHFAEHKLRTFFTVGGIALGVAAMVGIRLLHDSVSQSFGRTIERIAGKAVLEVSNGWVGVPEELLEELGKVPGVGAVAATVQGFVPVTSIAGEGLFVFGIDFLADQELRDYEISGGEGDVPGGGSAEMDDPLVFLAQPNSVALTDAFLETTGLALGGRIGIRPPAGPKTLTVRARLDVDTGPASLLGGRLAVMDIYAAQRLFNLDRRFTQIDIGLAEGADLREVETAVVAAVAGRGVVERPRTRGETLERLLGANRYSFTMGASLALVVGLYVIFNTMMIAVVQRRREIGTLRALGMRRVEVVRLVAAESLLLGAVGCASGVLLGLWLARLMVTSFALNVSFLYHPVEIPEIHLLREPVLLGVGLGMLSSFVAAILPAREAVRIHPIEALRSAATPGGSDGRRYSVAAIIGLVLAAGGTVTWIVRDRLGLDANTAGGPATLGLLIGVSLLTPAAVRAFARAFEDRLARLLGPLGTLASRGLTAQLGRVAITCSAFLVSLAGALATATVIASLERTFEIWFDSLFSSIDVVISSGGSPFSFDSTPLPFALAEEIEALPEVDEVDTVRFTRIAYQGSLPSLVAVDARLYQRGLKQLHPIEGEVGRALEALVRGEAVAVNEAFRLRFGRHAGETVRLRSPSGEVELPIAAVYFDFDDVGTVLVDRDLYRRVWQDDTVNLIEPILAPGADAAAVSDLIRRRWGDRHTLFLLTIDQYRKESEAVLAQSVSFAYPLIGMAIVIALLGVVNALLASVLDRVRQIGVLRAVGATRRQVATVVVIESAIIGLMGGALAVVVGSGLGYYQLEILVHGMLAVTPFFRYPTLAVLVTFVAAIALAAAAGWLPGRAAARLRITEALEYE